VALGCKIEFQVKGLRERLGLDDIISVLQQNSKQNSYVHVLQKEGND